MAKSNKVRVIVINPFMRTIEETDMPNNFEIMKRDYIKCDLAQVIDFGAGVDAWIDEEGLLVDNWDRQGFTQFAGGNQPFAGVIVLTGRSSSRDLADLPAFMTVELVASTVSFVDPKDVRIPGMTLTTFGNNGKPVTEHIGPEWLTYDNH